MSADEPANHHLLGSTICVENSDTISVVMSNKKIFIGANMRNNEKIEDERSCVQIGSMLLTLEEMTNHIKVLQGFPSVCKTFRSNYTRSQSNPITKSHNMEIPIPFGHGFVQSNMSGLNCLYLSHTESVWGV